MRWIRLNMDWDDTSWLFVLSEGSQLAWIKLLCHVKRDGVNGICKAMSTIVAAKRWGVGEESVSKMLEAGRNDGAIKCVDGHWEIVNWNKYQGEDKTNAERQKRWREKQKDSPQVQNVTDRNGVTPLVTPVTCTRDRDRDIDKDNYKPLTPKGEKFDPSRVELPACLQSPQGLEAWTDWVAHRKENKPLTQTAVKLQLKSLAEVKDPIFVLRRATENQWQGLNIKPEDKGKGSSKPPVISQAEAARMVR